MLDLETIQKLVINYCNNCDVMKKLNILYRISHYDDRIIVRFYMKEITTEKSVQFHQGCISEYVANTLKKGISDYIREVLL